MECPGGRFLFENNHNLGLLGYPMLFHCSPAAFGAGDHFHRGLQGASQPYSTAMHPVRKSPVPNAAVSTSANANKLYESLSQECSLRDASNSSSRFPDLCLVPLRRLSCRGGRWIKVYRWVRFMPFFLCLVFRFPIIIKVSFAH